MVIGTQLKQIRENKKLSQQELADYLNISQKTYSNFESNKSLPSLPQLAQLSELLDFSLESLLQEQGITFNQNNSEFKENSFGCTIYNTPEKLIQQYELRLQEKSEIIQLLKDKITYLEGEYM